MAITIAGVASCRVGDRQFAVKGSMKVTPGTPIREALEVATGPVGFKERAGTWMIEFETILEVNGMPLEEMAQLRDVAVTVRGRDGRIFALESAWAEGEWTLEMEESTVPARFKALRGSEVKPQAA